jgi:hypothetical protein
MRALAAIAIALAACGAQPPASAAEPAARERTLTVVQIALHGLPAATWVCSVQHESGWSIERRGVGERFELALPPGPCSLRLTSAQRVFAAPLSVGDRSPQEFAWELGP